MSRLRPVGDATFERDVLGAERPVVVGFSAPWCGPCEAVASVLEELEGELAGRAEVVEVDVDASPAAAARYGVLSLPTVILFADGEPRETTHGARGREHYLRAWEPWLPSRV